MSPRSRSSPQKRREQGGFARHLRAYERRRQRVCGQKGVSDYKRDRRSRTYCGEPKLRGKTTEAYVQVVV